MIWFQLMLESYGKHKVFLKFTGKNKRCSKAQLMFFVKNNYKIIKKERTVLYSLRPVN